MLAVQADGSEVTTVQGLAHDGEWTALQRTFHERHALQCGYCTPGMIMAARDLLREHPHPTPDEVRHGLAAAPPSVDAFVEGHSLAALERLAAVVRGVDDA